MPARPAHIVDPYLTLGLEPGAPAAEVKRAYRRLAKAFHPDSAGEVAIPRFLAIQAAYEQIRTGRVALGGSRPGRSGGGTGSGTGSGGSATGEPWRADPARARAARERARTGTAGARGGRTGGPASSGGSAGSQGAGSGASTAGGRRATGTSGAASGSTGTRRRAPRKATMGSTSYDEARDPSDATWSGASWYGPSTGEYWIVNPREYADPRKHGPDYQQRARRPLHEQAGGTDPEARAETIADVAPESTTDDRAGEAPAGTGGRGTTSGAAGRGRPGPRWAAATESGWTPAGDAVLSIPETDGPASPLRWLGAPADDPTRRFGLALVAWPPIGLAAAALIGDATGCATFGAGCDGVEPMLPWLAQAAILGLLLLLPPVARILAAGSVAALVGIVPVTAFLLAVGASGAPQAVPVMTVLLGVLWLLGVGWAAARVRRPGAAT